MKTNPVNLAQIVATYPRVGMYLEFKTFEFFRRTLTRLVRSLYNGFIGGEFVETISNLIRGQIIDAHVRAWNDEGGEGDPPPYLRVHAEGMVSKQLEHVQGFYTDIVDARINQTSIDPLLMRSDMWANRYNEAYNDAVKYITQESGGKLIWIYGEAEHCETCQSLNGIVAFASEWTTSGFKPQSAPNALLECGGWQCKCRLEVTTKRRTPKALDRLMNIAVSRVI
jgi:hypothetical protein